MDSGSIYGILYFLFMSAVILAAAYYVTKYLSRKGFNRGKNKNLKIIESVPLGIDKSLLLIKVGEQYMLIGNSQKNIFLLSEIDKEKLLVGDISEEYGGLDNENYESYINRIHEKTSAANSIKQNLVRLKTIVRGKKTDD
ncbi:MAG TPA: flagellar biosynthetic protein FliO [Bacillota bacterium]|nr:flagellar biosynthetic protein FliO [Bacillota bacterium]